MDLIKLIGVLIVVVGFILKFDTIATVLLAGIVTGFVANMSAMEILDVLGSSFINNRLATLFVLTLSVVGAAEYYGPKDKAIDFISGLKSATTGGIISIYQAIRTFAAAASLRLGGHAQFVRPLINPMAQAAAVKNFGELDVKTEDMIKGQCAAVENYGNFFAQNVFMGSSGPLLIVSTLTELGYEVQAASVAKWSIPIAITSVLVGFVANYLLDIRIKKRMTNGGAE